MDNDFRFVLHETPLDSYLAKSGPHKYISKKMVRGKWVYEYKDDVVKRVVDLLLDFLSNPARTTTLGQVARSFRVNNVMAKEVVDSLVAQKRIELVPGERGVPTYRQATPKEAKPEQEPVALDSLKLEWAKLGTKALRTMASSPKQKRILKEQKEIENKIDAIQGKGEGHYYPDSWVKEKPKPVVREPVKPVEKEKKASFARYQDQVMERLKAEPDGWLYYRGATRDLPLDGYEANKLIDALVERGLVTKDSKTWSSGTTETRIHLTAKGRGKKEEPKEPPKVLIEPPKKTKKELQAQKKELQREANKIHGAGGQLSLDFTVKLEMIDDKIVNADVDENAEKVMAEVQKTVEQPEPEPIAVGDIPDEEFTKEFGEHVWGSRKDRWDTVNTADDLANLPPMQQARLSVKTKLLPQVTPDELLARGVTPGGIVMRNAVEKCIQGKAADNLQARQHYMEGIAFVSRSLDSCETAQDVRDFIDDWHQMIQGRKRLRSFTKDEVFKVLFDHAQSAGEIPEDVTFSQYKEAEKEFEKARNELQQARGGMFMLKRGSPDYKMAQTVMRVRQSKLDQALIAFDKVGYNAVTMTPTATTIAEKYGLKVYDISLDRDSKGNYTLFIPDPDITQEIQSNPYAKFVSALGKNMINLVAKSSPAWHGPKVYKDAVSEVKHWDREEFSGTDKEEAMYKYLQTKTRGGSSGPRFWWERNVPGEIDRSGGPEIVGPVTVDRFATTFGFPNSQMGEWVKNDIGAAKSHLEGAHGAFLDLADLVGIDPKTVSLNGRLSMAFGGRGSGGARAHYEPAGAIINITKIAGGGSVAHEWAHAFDNLIARAYDPTNTQAMPMISDGVHQNIPEKIVSAYKEVMALVKFSVEDQKHADQLLEGAALLKKVAKTRKCTYEERKKIREYSQLRKRVKLSNFYKDAMALGGSSEKCYWTRGHEMFARAFEAYTEDTLSSQGRKSSYLVSGTQKKYNTGKKRMVDGEPSDVDAQVYPEGEERKRINEAMAKLVKALAEEKALEKSLRLLDEQFFIKAG